MRRNFLYLACFLCLCLSIQVLSAQERYELNTDWFCNPIGDTKENGTTLSQPDFKLKRWMPATVPGTVLTTLLNNEKVPDPFYAMNNNKIQDIYDTGREYYTYWFTKDFEETAAPGEQVWLKFRGINYSADVYLNGKKVNQTPFKGMYLRREFNITSLLNKNGKNRLAVLVHPADEVGNPNGGQGGDGTIAKGVALQYTAGWDWIQPVRDRNTGIWDKVFIEKTKSVNLKNPHIVTLVPGKRLPGETQEPATLQVSAELQNTQNTPVSGTLQYQLNGKTIKTPVTLSAKETKEIALPDFSLENPKLWWPSGYGAQNLYDLNLEFVVADQVSDSEQVQFGYVKYKRAGMGIPEVKRSPSTDKKSLLKEVTGSFQMRCFGFLKNVMMLRFVSIEI